MWERKPSSHGQEGTPALLLAHVVHEARCCKYLRPCSRRAPRVSHTCLGRSNPCRAPCGLCRPNPHAYAHSHTRAYTHAYRDSQPHSNGDARTHTYTGASDRYTHTHRDRYTDLYPNADCHAYGYPDSDADTQANGHAHAEAYAHAYLSTDTCRAS